MDPKWLVEGQANEEACTCGVCLMLMEEPTSGCSQGHCLCNLCYVRILEEATPAQSVCPVCKEKTNKKKLQRIRPLESVIDNLICKHAAGCEWSGTVSQLAAHRTFCPLEPVACENEGCKEQVARKDMKMHAEACNFHPTGKCKYCKSTVMECRFGLQPCLLPLPGEPLSPSPLLPGPARASARLRASPPSTTNPLQRSPLAPHRRARLGAAHLHGAPAGPPGIRHPACGTAGHGGLQPSTLNPEPCTLDPEV